MKRLSSVLAIATLAVAACAHRPPGDGATFDEAGLAVETFGDRGAPMIFIPGLSCGAWAWEATAKRFARDHVVYVVTLPGFDGRPPAGPSPLAAAEASVMALIDARKLARPILVGHSLGGTMAIHLAELHPDRIGGVVSVDGLPVFPRTEALLADQRPAYAERVKATIPRDPAAYAASQERYLNSVGGVIDPIVAKQLAGKAGASDPGSVANYLYDDLAADFRPALSRIAVPVLLVSPYNAPDFTVEGRTLPEAEKTAYYAGLMAGTPKVDVVSIAPARHFAMYDQPEKLDAAIRAYLATLPKR